MLGSTLGSESVIDLYAEYSVGWSHWEYQAEYGQGVSLAGDVNGDGFDDVMISNPYDDQVSIMLADGKGSIDINGSKCGGFGAYSSHGVVPPGDVNGDGIDDLIISDCSDSEADIRAGAIHLISGTLLSNPGSLDVNTDAMFSFQGVNAHDNASAWTGISIAGDVDGDGQKDILIGAFGDDTNANGAGAVYLILTGQ